MPLCFEMAISLPLLVVSTTWALDDRLLSATVAQQLKLALSVSSAPSLVILKVALSVSSTPVALPLKLALYVSKRRLLIHAQFSKLLLPELL